MLFALAGPPARAQDGDPAPAAPTSPVVRGVSWDVTGGGVPTSGALIHAQAGFPGLPTVAYHHSLRRGFSIGGLVGFDYGFFRPRSGFFEGLMLAVPMRWTIHRDGPWSAGLEARPGLLLGLYDGLGVGLMASVAGHATYALEHRLLVGGGLEIPLLLDVRSGGNLGTRLIVPVLVGPVAELHISPPLGLTVDMKVGAHLSSDAGARFAMKLMVGAVYRL